MVAHTITMKTPETSLVQGFLFSISCMEGHVNPDMILETKKENVHKTFSFFLYIINSIPHQRISVPFSFGDIRFYECIS